MIRIACLLACILASSAAAAQQLPPVPPELESVSAISCLRIDRTGAVTGAVLLTTTGDAARDTALLGWIGRTRWPSAKPGDTLAGAWFPMPFAFGKAAARIPPVACTPADAWHPGAPKPVATLPPSRYKGQGR